MPLEIFAILVPLGIAMIVLAVKYSGLSKIARLENTAAAVQVFENDFGGEAHKGAVMLSDDHGAAFIQMGDSAKLGLVEVFGDRFISRVLMKDDLKSAVTNGEGRVEIRFNDFTHPIGHYNFSNAGDAKTANSWLAKLEK